MQQCKGNNTINRKQHRLTKTVQTTAGGQNGKATADHLLIQITISKHHKKDLHIAFLDVTKA